MLRRFIAGITTTDYLHHGAVARGGLCDYIQGDDPRQRDFDRPRFGGSCNRDCVSRVSGDRLVVLQRFYSNAWHTTKSASLNSKSSYDIAFKPGSAGSFSYRVVARFTASPTVRIDVYRWHWLADLSTVDTGGCGITTGVMDINGTTYVHSVALDYFCDNPIGASGT